MKKSPFILLILILFLISPINRQVAAQSPLEILSQQSTYQYGADLTFQIEYSSTFPIQSLTLFIQAAGVPTFVGAVSLLDEGQGFFSYDLSSRPLPAFATVTYYYQFTLSNGDVVDSPSYDFTYLDNRFNWQELIEEPFKIFWYQGEIVLAQEVLDAAVEGQRKILELLQVPPDDQPITIFIYGSEADLQTSLSSVGQSWVGGHADPARGSVVVALPPAVDQPLEIQRLIPHELTHIYLYRFMGAEYVYLPAWFSEGLASRMEAYSLPEYDLVLNRAFENNDLIPMLHICQAFPTDPDLALLSYAQADSLVDYLRRQYGLPALQSMIFAYDQGLSCDRGVEASLGLTLAELDKEWQRATFGGGKAVILIYILVAVLLVVIVGLGVFIYTRLRSRSAEEWGGEETLPKPDPDLDDDPAPGPLSKELDFRMDADET
jgi:hypothetical protein